MLEEFKINDKVLSLSKEIEPELNVEFKKIDEICELNSLKVLSALKIVA